MNRRSGHLAEERIQAYLDERLSADERTDVRRHLDRCASCRAEMQAWRSVFARLDRIPTLAPSPGFADRVVEGLRERRSVPARIREWLQRLLPGTGEAVPTHPGTERILSYLDGALPDRRRGRVEAHLESCAACRRELLEWRRVTEALEDVGRFAPSDGFAEAVLSRVRVSPTAPGRSGTESARDLPGWLEALRPRSWKGWTVAGAAAAAPAVAMVAAALALFSHPLLTPTHLGAFLWWQVSGAARTLLAGAAQRALESPFLFQLWEGLQSLIGSPVVLGIGALAFSGATTAAVWILYRNLISTPSPERGYANP